MPTGTKFAAIAIVVLLGAAGLYFAFLSPSKPPKQSGSTATNSSAFSGSGANPATAAPSGARTTPETLTLTPNNGLAAGTSPSTTPTTGFGTTPTPSNTTGTSVARNDQPTFAPGATGSTAGGGKGDSASGALAPGGLSGVGTTTTRPTANPLATNSTGMNGFAPSGATSGATAGTGTTTPGTAVANRNGPTPTGAPAATVPQSGTATPAATGSTSEQTYVVKKGDSLSTIAQQFYGSAKEWKRIANANPLVDPNAMKVGAKLRIPGKSDGGSTAVASAETTKPTTTGGSAGGTSGGSQSHTVASGDTLSSISTKYYGSGKHWNKIYASNKSVIGTDPGNLKVGQKLTIPSRTTVVGAETVER